MPRSAKDLFEIAKSIGHKSPALADVHATMPMEAKWELIWQLQDYAWTFFEAGVVSAMPHATDEDVRDCWFRATLEPEVYEGYYEHVRRQREKKATEQRVNSDSDETNSP